MPKDESRPLCAMCPLKTSPDFAQVQAKSSDNSLAEKVIDVYEFLGFPPGAVHIDRPPIRIYQPPKRRPVIDPLAHLRLRLGQSISTRHSDEGYLRLQ